MDISDGPNWFGIAFSLVFFVPATLLMVALAVAVWILVGSSRFWNAILPRQATPMFPREAADELGTRRRIIWSVRGFVLGWPLAFGLQALTVGFNIPFFDGSREWFSENSEWFTSALPAIGATIGAALAARGGTKRVDALGKPRLGDYVSRWMWMASAASVASALVTCAFFSAAGSEQLLASTLGLSSALALVAFGAFLLGWRSLLTRSAGGPSPAWADATRATALWFLVLLPVVLSLGAFASLADRLVEADGPFVVPLGIFAYLLDFAALPQTILLLTLALAPLRVTRERHPEYYEAIRPDWSAFRRWVSSLRAASPRRRDPKAPAGTQT